MFRIDRIYSNAQVEFWKVSGEIRLSHLTDWAEALNTLPLEVDCQIILDLCEVAYLSPEAVAQLIDHITTNTFIANCSASVRNMIGAAGLSSQVLG